MEYSPGGNYPSYTYNIPSPYKRTTVTVRKFEDGEIVEETETVEEYFQQPYTFGGGITSGTVSTTNCMCNTPLGE